MRDHFASEQLFTAPTLRAAFSDRQPYVCAELSRLPYFDTEGGHSVEQIPKIAKNNLNDDSAFEDFAEQLSAKLRMNLVASEQSNFAFGKLLAPRVWDDRLNVYIDEITAYRRPGYVKNLVGTKKSAWLRYKVSSFDRLNWLLSMIIKRRFSEFTKIFSDHDINLYVEKLANHVLKRQ
jgi:hypothetical protein